MRRLIDKIKDIWRIDELRTRIVNTFLFLLVYRLGSFVILPGVDSDMLAGLQKQSSDSLLGLVNIFAGGAFARGAILALGIMPYISASIFMQLISLAVPAFARMQKEGEEGRRKINQYTRILTIAFTAVQAVGYLNNIITTPGNRDALLFVTNPDAMSQGWFMVTNVLLLTAGTMFTMWLGERITDKGLGNGISLLIMVGIIARLPNAFATELVFSFTKRGPFIFLIEIFIWVAVVLTVILLTQGTRKIPVNYAKRIVGNRQYGGQRNYIPMKVLGAGVMPIIFAQAIMFLPASFIGLYKDGNVPGWLMSMADYTSFGHNALLVTLIILFTYFYTAIIFNSNQIAEDMKRNNGFIPGIKPGKKTADFIDEVISRITLPGAIFISAVAIMPAIAQGSILGVNPEFAQFYGGTSLLILVGVVLDTLQQIESFLLMRHYDGLMRSGRIKGRMGMMQQQQVGN
jgi:preprotein translocase subunit SecY